ncbi:MAG: sialidase family protein [Planctomycetia bacterium]|nr:sialidase family protein [Planctomycetia bacterium]
MKHTISWGIVPFFCLLASVVCVAQEGIRLLDISNETARHTIIAQGTPTLYQGHPYSAMMPDGETVFCVWCVGHGGPAGPMAKSTDGGKTWARWDSHLPEGYAKHRNCPSIYRLVNADGEAFLWVFSAQPRMARIVSADDGETWEEKAPLGIPNVMAFSTIIPKNPGVQDGQYLGFYHHRAIPGGVVFDGEPRGDKSARLEVMVAETSDAGFTWSAPRLVASVEGKDPCEPCAFWSPDKSEIAVLMRENRGTGRALVTFSRDKGATWDAPKNTSWELTGHRHIGTYLPDGRLFFAFRDTAPNSPTRGSFVGWVGSYDDVKNSQPGDVRILLLRNHAGWDCGYPGVFVTKDQDIVALTYLKYDDSPNKHSVVATRFRMEDLRK